MLDGLVMQEAKSPAALVLDPVPSFTNMVLI